MTPLGIVLLVVALVSLAIYTTALLRLLHRRESSSWGERETAVGLVRTAASRVAGAVLYAGFAGSMLLAPSQTGVTAAVVFITVQLLWWVNAVADVALRRRLSAPAPRHAAEHWGR